MKTNKNIYGYALFKEWQWRSYNGKNVIDLDSFIESHKEDLFFIGTDSQNYSKKHSCIFTTALIGYRMGLGGSIIIHRDKVPFMDALRQRLLMEAMRSLETAWYVDKMISDKTIISIHLDVNKNLKFKSGKYKNELVGLITSQGFDCKVKPDAFAASKTADKKCR
jgi:predicted RNase H-related nuclease YkuK (DUF458 family)